MTRPCRILLGVLDTAYIDALAVVGVLPERLWPWCVVKGAAPRLCCTPF